MLALVLAISLSHAAGKRELLECTVYKTEAEVAACVAEWERRRKINNSNEEVAVLKSEGSEGF